jgi:hypothetical protein
VSHNYFSQIHGKKRFRLWGPKHHWALRVFPDAHPRARKSQIDIDCDPLAPAPALDVTLEPGDALIIPAFWFHHVEAIGDVSVSINVFSEASPKLAAAEVLSQPVPSGLVSALESGSFADVTTQFRYAADALCTLAGVEDHGGTFLHRLLESRYKLLETDLGGLRGEESAPHSSSVPEEVDYAQFLLPEFHDITPRSAVAPNFGTADDMLRELSRIRSCFDHLAATAGAGDEYRRGLIDITLCHLLELWAVRTVQADNVEQLLQDAAARA